MTAGTVARRTTIVGNLGGAPPKVGSTCPQIPTDRPRGSMSGGLPSTDSVEDGIQIPIATEPQLATGDVHRMCIPDPLHVQVHANMIWVHVHAQREAKARDQGGNLLPPWSHTFATTIVKLVLITPNIFNSCGIKFP